MELDSYLGLKLAGIAWLAVFGVLGLRSLGLSLRARVIFLALIILGGFFGSKLWYVIQHLLGREPYPYEDPVEMWNDAGSVLYGWILGGALTAWAGALILERPVWAVWDRLAAPMLMAQILNRLGCFAAGCCWGKGPCDLPWAVSNEMAPGMVIHPVQLYEAAWDGVVLALLWLLARRSAPEGRKARIYLLGYAFGRFLVEFYRGDHFPVSGLTVPQWTSLIIVLALLIYPQKRAVTH